MALGIVVVLFFASSFALDRLTMNDSFKRVPDRFPNFLPSEEYAAEYGGRSVEFQFQGATLRGFVYEAGNPKGFVVFRHGFASQHTDYLALICALVDRGWTVFAYDAIGCGISDGDNIKGMPQSPLDVAAAVDYARESGLVGSLPLILWGHSWGGYGVAAALDIVPDVSACVAMSGFNAPVDVLMEFAKRSMGPVAITQYPTMWLNNKLAFGADSDRTALDGINKTDVPVLIIHGTDDQVVEYGGSATIAQRDRITNENVQYLVIDESGRNGHNSYFYSAEANAYLDEIAAEFEELEGQYPDGIPDTALEGFMGSYDVKRANKADSDLMKAIDDFLTAAIGEDNVEKPKGREYGSLKEAKYSRSGNSLGNVYLVEALRDDAGAPFVRVSESPVHNEPCDIREYSAPDDLFERIEAIVDRAGMKEWGELPLSELIAYDAPTVSLSLQYAAADQNDVLPLWLSTSFTYELPEGGEAAVLEIRDLMLACTADENLLREYKETLR